MELEKIKRKDRNGYDYYFASEIYSFLGYADLKDLIKDIYEYENKIDDNRTFSIEFDDYILSNKACRYLAIHNLNNTKESVKLYFDKYLSLEYLTSEVLEYMNKIDKINSKLYDCAAQQQATIKRKNLIELRKDLIKKQQKKLDLISDYVYIKER